MTEASSLPSTFVYDGSFDGWLSVVFEATRRGEVPAAITAGAPLVLGPTVEVATDADAAERVRVGLDRRAPEATARLYAAFLSETPGVEATLFRLVQDLIARGPAAMSDWRSAPARETHRLAAMTWREVHRMHAFVRFEQRADDHFVAVIRPGPHVLPLLTPHFASRFGPMRWAIVDAGRGLALVHTPPAERAAGEPPTRIVPAAPVESLERLPDDARVQAMWQTYFRAVDIPERQNLDLQRRHVPKRYWADMTELRPA